MKSSQIKILLHPMKRMCHWWLNNKTKSLFRVSSDVFAKLDEDDSIVKRTKLEYLLSQDQTKA